MLEVCNEYCRYARWTHGHRFHFGPRAGVRSALAAISMIFVMLVPLPAAGLDLLLAMSMAASIIVFLSAMQIRRAVELSVFPTSYFC